MPLLLSGTGQKYCGHEVFLWYIHGSGRFDGNNACGLRRFVCSGDGAGLIPQVYSEYNKQSPIISSHTSDGVHQLGCLAELIPQSACTLTDINCLCTNVPLNANLTVCVLSSCTTYEGLGKQSRLCRTLPVNMTDLFI